MGLIDMKREYVLRELFQSHYSHITVYFIATLLKE